MNVDQVLLRVEHGLQDVVNKVRGHDYVAHEQIRDTHNTDVCSHLRIRGLRYSCAHVNLTVLFENIR